MKLTSEQERALYAMQHPDANQVLRQLNELVVLSGHPVVGSFDAQKVAALACAAITVIEQLQAAATSARESVAPDIGNSVDSAIDNMKLGLKPDWE